MKTSNKNKSNIARKNILGLMIISAICLFLVINGVTAIKDKIFEDYVESGSLITLNSKDYSLYVHATYISITGGASEKISLGECANANNIEFCFLAKLNTKALISISYLLPDLTVERTLDDNEVYIGEESQITILVTNDGDFDARNITLFDEFPDFIEISSVSGSCTKTGNKIKFFKDKLSIGADAECTYNIKPFELVDLGLTAQYSYYNGISTENAYTSKINIKSETGVETIITASEDHNVGDEFEFAIELENNNNNNFDVSIRVVIPDKIELDDNGDFEINGNELTQEFELRDGTIKELTSNFVAKKPGTGEFIIFITYSNDNEKLSQTETYSKRITIDKDVLEILTNFENDNENVESSQTILLDFEIKNPNKDMKFKNLDVTFSSPLFYIEPTYIDELGPETQKTILNRVFIIPNVSQKTRYEIKTVVDYETEYGEKHSEIETKYITVDKTGSLNVEHEIDGNLNFNEEVELNTIVKNTKYIDIDLACIEETFVGFQVLRGVSRICFDIESNSDEELLKYLLKVTDSNKAYIISTVTYESEDENKTEIYNETFNLNNYEVENKDLSVSLDTSESTYYQGETFDVEFELKSEFSKPIYNISFELPKMKEFDYYSDKILINKVNPGETIKLSSAFKLRGKVIGSYSFDGLELTSYSEEGIKYITKFNKLSLKITNTSIDNAALVVYRNVSKQNNKTMLNYEIVNVGKKDSSAILYDDLIGLNKGIFIEHNSEANIKVTVELEDLLLLNGTFARVEYETVGNTKTYSEKISYDVLKKLIKDIEDDINSEIIIISNTTVNETEIEDIPELNLTENITQQEYNRTIIVKEPNEIEPDSKTDAIQKKNLISEIINFIMRIFGIES
ncbi:hypothetical protein JXM83_04185 [Candidatus Woesearchaeota archaeon]|nr:hypothetical protein [Candidatus Woesearchaeota archaeon]